jgi:hypothetical protein
MIADIATAADLAALDTKIDRLTILVESIANRDKWLPVKVAADSEHCNCDPRTLVSAGERGEITIRRVGRRVLVLASSLRPTPPATVAELAAGARR